MVFFLLFFGWGYYCDLNLVGVDFVKDGYKEEDKGDFVYKVCFFD